MLLPLVACPVLVSALDGDAADIDASWIASLLPIRRLAATRRAVSRVDEAIDRSLPVVDSGTAGAAPGKLELELKLDDRIEFSELMSLELVDILVEMFKRGDELYG